MKELDTATPQRALRAHLPPTFRTFLVLSLALFVACVVYLVLQVSTHSGPQYGLPLDLYTRLPFYDLIGYVVLMPKLHQPGFFRGNWAYSYPAPSVFLFKFFSLFMLLPIRHRIFGSISVYLLAALAGLLHLRHRFALGLKQQGMPSFHAGFFSWSTLLLSWPILYCLHQGNVEVLLWMGIAVAIWLYRQNRWWACAVVVGIVGSFKLYPLAFLLLLLPVRQWRAIAFGALAFAAMTIAGLAYIGPTIPLALHQVDAGVAAFSSSALSVAGVPHDSKPFDHSVDGLLHRTLGASPAAIAYLNRWYLPVGGLLFLILFLGRVRKLPPANQVLFLTLSAVTLPPISFDYTLQLLYVPFAWIVLDSVQSSYTGTQPKWLGSIMICFALLFSPELFLDVEGVMFYGQFKAVILLLLFGLCLVYRFDGTGDLVGTSDNALVRSR